MKDHVSPSTRVFDQYTVITLSGETDVTTVAELSELVTAQLCCWPRLLTVPRIPSLTTRSGPLPEKSSPRCWGPPCSSRSGRRDGPMMAIASLNGTRGPESWGGGSEL